MQNILEEKETLLTVKNIKKSYKSGDTVTNALKGIDLTVYKGELLCILGESGSGKTTLLNILGGIDKQDDGEIYFESVNLSNATEKELTLYRRENLGYIFQAYNLMPNLTAIQNIELISELVKNPLEPLKALELVGLSQKKDSYPSELSGGQQQRVSIARAIVKNPKLIVADEPTASLDYATSIEVLTVFENIISNGTSLIMVTHNEEIAKMANRVIRIRDGKVFETIVNEKPLKAKELVW